MVGHGLIAAAKPLDCRPNGRFHGFLQFVGYELVIIPGLIVLALVVGYLPAMAAYRTDVAKALSAQPRSRSRLAGTTSVAHWRGTPAT